MLAALKAVIEWQGLVCALSTDRASHFLCSSQPLTRSSISKYFR
jgi:hypothetical protein